MKQSTWRQEHIKKLDWAIHFCQDDLGGLREGGWLDLKEDLAGFINASPIRLGGPRLEDFTKVGIEAIQASFRRQLEPLAFDENNPKDSVSTERVEAKASVFGAALDCPFMDVVDVGSDVDKRAIRALFDCLVWSGVLREQLRVCPVCRRIFLSKRKPRKDVHLHCSIRCSRLAATHRYREKQRDRLKHKERERSRRRHVEKQQRKYPGRKVKVGRIPRKARES